jgi:hypothetical protein
MTDTRTDLTVTLERLTAASRRELAMELNVHRFDVADRRRARESRREWRREAAALGATRAQLDAAEEAGERQALAAL